MYCSFLLAQTIFEVYLNGCGICLFILQNLCHDGNPEGTKYDGSDIFKDLGDLSHLDGGLANCFNIYDLDQLLREG